MERSLIRIDGVGVRYSAGIVQFDPHAVGGVHLRAAVIGDSSLNPGHCADGTRTATAIVDDFKITRAQIRAVVVTGTYPGVGVGQFDPQGRV
jgi:hypothetical protein